MADFDFRYLQVYSCLISAPGVVTVDDSQYMRKSANSDLDMNSQNISNTGTISASTINCTNLNATNRTITNEYTSTANGDIITTVGTTRTLSMKSTNMTYISLEKCPATDNTNPTHNAVLNLRTDNAFSGKNSQNLNTPSFELY